MRSNSYPSHDAHAVGWHAVMAAIGIVVLSVLLVLIAASTVHALPGIGSASIDVTSAGHADAVIGDTQTPDIAICTEPGEAIARSVDPPLHYGRDNGLHPLAPDPWLDEEDDDDDEEGCRRSLSLGSSAFSVEETLGLRRPSRALGGSAVPDGGLPVNLFLAECVRRM